MFITFEGLDGSGKSTHSQMLTDFLRSQNRKVILTREPGGTLLGEDIRNLVLNRGMSARTKTFMFSAARSHLVEKVIRPALEDGVVVVCDRYIDSTVAYQGVTEIELALAYTVNAFSSYGLYPDISFYLYVSPDISVARSQRKDMVDSGDVNYLSEVAGRYEQETRNNPERWITVDTSLGYDLELSQKTIRREVWVKLLQREGEG